MHKMLMLVTPRRTMASEWHQEGQVSAKMLGQLKSSLLFMHCVETSVVL